MEENKKIDIAEAEDITHFEPEAELGESILALESGTEEEKKTE